MAGYKETPRQKMIAMMYLVLTALLALNVSKEMLDAFFVVNKSVEKTQENFDHKLASAYAEFENQYMINPTKVEEAYNKAQQAKALTSKFITYVDSVKYTLIDHTDRDIESPEQAKNTPLEQILGTDRYSEPTNYFFRDTQDGEKGEGGKLKRAYDAFRVSMLELVGLPADSDRLGMLTNGDYRDKDGKKLTWIQYNFYYTILAADITILNKMISEAKSAEFDVVNMLYAGITAEDFKFDNISAKVIPKTNYILQGQEYEAEVLVAAYDTKTEISADVISGTDKLTENMLNRATNVVGDSGIVHLSFKGNDVGPQSYAGRIIVKDPVTGRDIYHEFNADYIVAPPSLTVAATKMNVFYIGVENPVSISVPGVAKNNLFPSITEGATLKEDEEGHDWIVEVPKGMRECIISATASFDGEMLDMGARTFRVKRVPDPVAQIAGQKEGQIEKNTLLAASAIIPEMIDFEFELYFQIQSYTLGTIINGDWIPKNARGNTFTPEISEMIRNAKAGQKFFFENIIAVGPDGTKRTLNTVNLTIK